MNQNNFELKSEKDLTVNYFNFVELVTYRLLFQHDIKDNAILASMQCNLSHIIHDKKYYFVAYRLESSPTFLVVNKIFLLSEDDIS